jgi:7-cyano-7-deazaguanine synthase in queuosine biosynthesis
MNKEVILFTAGVDSYILREYLIQHGHDVDCLYFNLGGRYSNSEIKMLDRMPFDVIRSDILLLKGIEQPDAFIPNRNILMSIAANSLGYDTIWVGGSKSDRVNDNNEVVFEKISDLLTTTNKRYVKVDSPFWNCYKDDMVKWFSAIKNPIDLVTNTFSCFYPFSEDVERVCKFEKVKFLSPTYSASEVTDIKYQTSECMNCPACFRKSAVLFNANIFINFENDNIIEKYYQEFKNEVISTPRSITTLKYINYIQEHRLVH